MKGQPFQQSRSIRVFISSTFRDMQEERDVLMKFVFPKLRKLCEERGVTFTEVDLRWGITEEQAHRGEVLPICLAEIDRCRPFFIGLLGERYGWVADEIPEELIQQHAWLCEHRKKSVTELEIIHGVLTNPTMANRACFYFRDPEYFEQIPEEQRSDYIEKDPVNRENLRALKECIRSSKVAWHDNYPHPHTLGEWVHRDLTTAINQEFPPESQPSPLDREAALHEAFARSRMGVYIGRKEYFDRLDQHVATTNEPLVILGESGSGKSALLANWATNYRRSHPDEIVLLHFVGASADSSDWSAMLRRIMRELNRHFDIAREIPSEIDKLRAEFANWLHIASARCGHARSSLARERWGEGNEDKTDEETRASKIILIIDAINQLEDRDGAPDLVWLPLVIPDEVRLIVSTLRGRPLDELENRAWPTLTIDMLTVAERTDLIRDYLQQYTKQLNEERTARIANCPQGGNPLYLRALLEELRVFGIHEQLDKRMTHYLEAETIPHLYQRILERYEQDYDRERPGIVRDAMSLIWASRRGLSEAELLDLLGSDNHVLPHALWSPFHLAAEQSLVNRGGLISFSHDYIRQAIQKRYLSNDDAQSAAHLRLADYFGRRSSEARCLEEYPWQLCQARSWQRLYDLLADLPFFISACKANEFDVKMFWAQVEDSSLLRMVNAYRAVLDSPEKHLDAAWSVANLLADTAYPLDALLIRKFLATYYRDSGNHVQLQACLGNLANTLQAQGEIGQPLALHREEEQICRDLKDLWALSGALRSQAGILYLRGELNSALNLYTECERICREVEDKDGLQKSLCGQALILDVQGHSEKALALYDQQARMCRELGSKDGLASSLGNKAGILHKRGELAEASRLLYEQERIYQELGDAAGLARCRGNRGKILYAQGNLDEAIICFRDQALRNEELNNKEGLADSLGHQALIFADWGRHHDAMNLLSRQEEICRGLENMDMLRTCLVNKACVVNDLGDADGALDLLKDAESICRALGHFEGLQECLANQTAIRKSYWFARLLMCAILITIVGFCILLGIWNRWLWLITGPVAFVLFIWLSLLVAQTCSTRLRRKLVSTYQLSHAEGEEQQVVCGSVDFVCGKDSQSEPKPHRSPGDSSSCPPALVFENENLARYQIPDTTVSFLVSKNWWPKRREGGGDILIWWEDDLGQILFSINYGPSLLEKVTPPPPPYNVVGFRICDGVPMVEAELVQREYRSRKLALIYDRIAFHWTFYVYTGIEKYAVLWDQIINSVRLVPLDAELVTPQVSSYEIVARRMAEQQAKQRSDEDRR